MSIRHLLVRGGLALLLLATVGLTLLPAQTRVVAPQQRAEMLATAETVLAPPDDVMIARIEASSSPFRPEEPEAEEVAPTTEEAPLVVEGELSPARVLRAVAAKFQPSGAIVRENRQVLIMPGGGTLPAGSAFRARIDGEIYTITIENVTSREYTLRLGNAALVQSLEPEDDSRGRMEFTTPAPTENPEG